MPRVNRKRKNNPPRKPKPIKFNQNEIESEVRKAAEVTATEAGVVEALPTPESSSVGETSVNVVAEDAINNKTPVISDEIAAFVEGDNLTLEENDITSSDDDDDDEITSKLNILSITLSHSLILFPLRFGRAITFGVHFRLPRSRCLRTKRIDDERHR